MRAEGEGCVIVLQKQCREPSLLSWWCDEEKKKRSETDQVKGLSAKKVR
jgi:hypothetical protein